jgi:hypothetical protein
VIKLSESVTCLVLAALLAVSIARPAQADDSIVSGSLAARGVHCLTRAMTWYTNLDQAREAARSSGRLIVWIHMLGTIDGAT